MHRYVRNGARLEVSDYYSHLGSCIITVFHGYWNWWPCMA